jgi:hypothetical protein
MQPNPPSARLSVNPDLLTSQDVNHRPLSDRRWIVKSRFWMSACPGLVSRRLTIWGSGYANPSGKLLVPISDGWERREVKILSPSE